MVIIVGMCCLNFSANRPKNLIRILAEFGIRITMIILMPTGLTGCGVCMKFGLKSVTAIRSVFIILSYYNLSYNNLAVAAHGVNIM